MLNSRQAMATSVPINNKRIVYSLAESRTLVNVFIGVPSGGIPPI